MIENISTKDAVKCGIFFVLRRTKEVLDKKLKQATIVYTLMGYIMKNEERQSKVQSHLHRIIGQLQGLEKMIEQKRDCEEIITQLMAARASLEKLGLLILQDESSYCSINNDSLQKRLQHLEKITSKLFKLT